MKCPACGSTEHFVIDSRPNTHDSSIRRRRECENKKCQHRFTSYERLTEEKPKDEVTITVKKNGRTTRYAARPIGV